MVNFGLLAAEIRWRVWGTPANFNGCRVLAALLHGTVVVGVSQTLRHWTEGATYIRQGGHRVGHWPTFLVYNWSLRYKIRGDNLLLLTLFVSLITLVFAPGLKAWVLCESSLSLYVVLWRKHFWTGCLEMSPLLQQLYTAAFNHHLEIMLFQNAF